MSLEAQVFMDLRRHEGCRLSPYRDTEGVWTAGYGHTKHVTQRTPKISQQQAEDWLFEDYTEAVTTARKIVPSFNDLDFVRKTVIINMAFNLGYRLRGFKKFLAAVESKQWGAAALEMLDSKWAAQVKQRATELAARMSSGVIPLHQRYRGDK